MQVPRSGRHGINQTCIDTIRASPSCPLPPLLPTSIIIRVTNAKMKSVLAFAILAFVAHAQVPTPPEDPPQIPPPETDLPPPSDLPPVEPGPIEPPPETSPGEPEQPAPPTILTPPAPSATGDPVFGPICECGYTYCASVLQAMGTSSPRVIVSDCILTVLRCPLVGEPARRRLLQHEQGSMRGQRRPGDKRLVCFVHLPL